MRELIEASSEVILGFLAAGLVLALFYALLQPDGLIGHAAAAFAQGIC